MTVGIAGAGALLGGETLLPAAVSAPEAAAAVAPVTEETEALTPFAQQYLSRSGGRLGSTATRRQLYEIAEEHAATGKYTRFRGDGRGPEEFIKDITGGRGTFVDFTAKGADGSITLIQTVDTLADGITPTARELAAAARIRRLCLDDKLTLVPKR